MPYRRKILTYLLLLLSYSAFSQNTRITVKLFKEGKQKISHKPLKVILICEDTITLDADKASFVMPDLISGNKYTIVLTQNRYRLILNDIYVGWNDKLPLWKIDIDYAPINKDEAYSIPKEYINKIRWRYTLERGNGTVLTWYGFKRPFS
ncbi:hypothetical protein [Spirosoma litoris]